MFRKFTIIFMFIISNLILSQTVEYSKYDPSKNPEEQLKQALVEAQKNNKNIMLFVGGEWCPWCRMLSKVFSTEGSIKTTANLYYVMLKINFSPDNKNEKFLSQYPKFKGYPHIFVLDSKGKLLQSQDTAELEEGKGYNNNKIIKFLKKWKK